MLKMRKEGGVYTITTADGEIRVVRSRYAFKIAQRLLDGQGMKARPVAAVRGGYYGE